MSRLTNDWSVDSWRNAEDAFRTNFPVLESRLRTVRPLMYDKWSCMHALNAGNLKMQALVSVPAYQKYASMTYPSTKLCRRFVSYRPSFEPSWRLAIIQSLMSSQDETSTSWRDSSREHVGGYLMPNAHVWVDASVCSSDIRYPRNG